MEGLAGRAHSYLLRGTVQKARKNGRLVLFADGSINAAASDSDTSTEIAGFMDVERAGLANPPRPLRDSLARRAGGVPGV